MALYRALAIDSSGMGNLEIKDTDTLQVGTVAPAAGNLTIGGAAGSNVVVTAGQTLTVSGATGGINLTGGADLLAAAGSTLQGFDSIEGILSTNLVDKSASETITGQWTFKSSNVINPKLIVQAAGGEIANSLLFQVQDSVGNNLFSVDVEGDVVVAGGETVAGATIYTGNVTLGDGGNTVKIGGSPLGPLTTGDTVIISTMGGAGGVNSPFSISSPNFNVDTAGIIDTNGNVIVVNADSVGGTAEYSGTVWLDGDGASEIEGWRLRNNGAATEFAIQYKPDPANAFNLGEAWTSILTATPSSVTVNGTLSATTISGTVVGDGTNSNVWVANLDAVLGTPELSMLVSAGGDGAAVQAWRWFNNTAAKDFLLQYKQNPTSLISTVEAGYLTAMTAHSTGIVDFGYNVNAQAGLDVTGAALTVDANGIDCAGGIDLNGTLSFDGVAASIIDTSGTNADLTINVGTGDILVTATLVDLQTNVSTLDVPDGTGFSIGGTALTTANFTAVNVDTLLDGSNADLLHTHATASVGQVTIPNIDTSAMTRYRAGYISGTNAASNTDCSAGSGTFTTASFAGVCEAAPANPGSLVTNGKVQAQFEIGFVPGVTLNPGDPAILSWTTAGQFRPNATGAPNNSYVVRVGTVMDVSTYGAPNYLCTILLHPTWPVKK